VGEKNTPKLFDLGSDLLTARVDASGPSPPSDKILRKARGGHGCGKSFICRIAMNLETAGPV